jgi:uncharacterized spore protein YtfJ
MDPQQVLAGAQDSMAARRVFGEPISAASATILPVAVVSGGGGGGAKGEAGGVGFGVRARAAGVFVIRDGNASWRPAVDINRIVLGGQLVAITALLVLAPVLDHWLNRPTRA